MPVIDWNKDKHQGDNLSPLADPVESSYKSTLATTPEEEADVLRISKDLGAKPATVKRNLDMAREAAGYHALRRAVSSAPVLERKMADPSFMAMSKDDTEALAELEYIMANGPGTEYEEPTMARQVFGSIAGGFTGVAHGIGAGMYWAGDVYAGISKAGAKTAASLGGTDVTVDTERNFMMDWGAVASRYWKEKTREVAPEYRGTFMENPSWMRGAAAVFQAIPSLIMAAGATVATGGNVYAGAAFLSATEAAPTYEEAKEAGKGRTYSTGVAGLSGVGTFLLEKFGLEKILKGGGGRLTRMMVGGISEGSTESAQTIMQNTISKYGYDETRGVWDGLIESFIGGSGAGGGMAFVVGSSMSDDDVNKLAEILGSVVEGDIGALEKAGASKELISEIQRLSGESKLAERSPEAFGQFLQEVAEEHGVEKVYLQADEALEKILEAGENPVEWADKFGISVNELQTAVESGGDIQLPIGRVAALFQDDMALKELADSITVDAKDHPLSRVDNQIEADVEVRARVTELQEAESRKVFQPEHIEDLTKQLVEVGRNGEQAKAEATLIAARANTWVKEMSRKNPGKSYTVEDWFARHGDVKIQRGLSKDGQTEEVQYGQDGKREGESESSKEGRESDVGERQVVDSPVGSKDQEADTGTVSGVTGLQNRSVYDKAERLPIQVSIDLDSLKWVNDNVNHDMGNQFLQAFGNILRSVGETMGVEVYHFSGDEFAIQSNDLESASRAMKLLQEAADSATLEMKFEDGNQVTLTRLPFGFGSDQEGDFNRADKRLNAEKDRRAATGERAARDEIPRHIEVRDNTTGDILDPDSTRNYFETRRNARKTDQGIDPLREFMREYAEFFQTAEPPLVVQHNLSLANLIHADKMGGLPVPSLAIGSAREPFVSFGEISLVGDKALVDPRIKSNKVVAGDAYSPRYPTISYTYNYKAVEDLNADLATRWSVMAHKEIGHINPYVYAGDLEDNSFRWVVENSAAAVTADFLKNNGKRVTYERYTDGDINPRETARSLFKRASKIDGFDEYLDGLEKKLGIEDRIFDGFSWDGSRRKYLRHDLDTVVRILKREFRGGENFNYGTGNLRAKVAPQFKSIKQIQDLRSKIMSGVEFQAVKDEVSDELVALADRFRNMNRHGDDEWNYLDIFTAHLGEMAERRNIRAVLAEYYDYGQEQDIPGEDVQAIADFLNKLREMPTEYFEAKIQRAVNLSEFTGALVPHGPEYSKAIEILKGHGVKVQRYTARDEDSRVEALGKFSRTFFQSDVSEVGFFSALSRAVATIEADSMPAKDWLNRLNKTAGVKQDELKWTGLSEFLEYLGSSPETIGELAADPALQERFFAAKEKGETIPRQSKVYKRQILDFLDANGVQVEEVQRGETDDSNPDDLTANYRDNLIIEEGSESGTYEAMESDPGGSGIVGYGNSEDAAMLDYIRQVEEELPLQDRFSPTKYADYQLPGGEDYQELLLTLPGNDDTRARGKALILKARRMAKAAGVAGKVVNDWPPEAQAVFQEGKALVKSKETVFRSPHWDEGNVLAHIRFNSRETDGEKVLFLEEIQSDWAIEGRKKGFGPLETRADEIRTGLDTIIERYPDMSTAELYEDDAGYRRLRDELYALNEERRPAKTPAAPFVTSNAWQSLVLKRMLRYAAENGFARIAWINGEQTAERYSLDKKVEKLVYRVSKDGKYLITIYDTHGGAPILNDKVGDPLTESELENLVGKEIAKRIVDGQGITNPAFAGAKVLKGDDLKIEAAWARNLYDKAIPSFMKKFGKKYGAGVEEVKLGEHSRSVEEIDREMDAILEQISEPFGRTLPAMEVVWRDHPELSAQHQALQKERNLAAEPQVTTQQSLPITDAMRQEIQEQGLPLFQEGQVRRGSIRFRTGGVDISLFEGANLSTFLHESGHWFLEDLRISALQDGINQEEWASIKRFLGVEHDAAEITVKQHEKFARAFEKYLGEGKAPSLELEPAFRKYKHWIVNVYRSLAGLNVELTDEVRNTFDRLLATPGEIQEARSTTGMVQMLDDAFMRKQGASPKEAAEYAAVIGKSEELAQDNRDDRKLSINQLRMRDRAAKESLDQPIYRALFYLARGVFPPDTALPHRLTDEGKVAAREMAGKSEDAYRGRLEELEDLYLDAEVGDQGEFSFSLAESLISRLSEIPLRLPPKGKRGGEYDGWNTLFESRLGRRLSFKIFSKSSSASKIDQWVSENSDWLQGKGIDPTPDGVWEVLNDYSTNYESVAGSEDLDRLTIDEMREGVAAQLLKDHPDVYEELIGPLPQDHNTGKSGKGIGLDIESLKSFGVNPTQLGNPGLVRKMGGATVEHAAVETDYFNPHDFLVDLKKMKPRDRWIEEKISELQAEHDAALDPEEDILNQHNERMLAIEAKWLAKAAGGERRVLARKAIKLWAQGRLEGMTLREATDVNGTLVTMRKLRTQAIAAQHKGNHAGAFDLNERVRLNEELVRVKYKTREALGKMQRSWGQSVEAKVENGYRNQLHRILSTYRLTDRKTGVDEDAPSLSEFFSELKADATKVGKDGKLVNPLGGLEIPVFSSWLTGGQKVGPYKQTLTWGELQELNDMVQFLVGRGKDSLKQLLSDKKTEVGELAHMATEESRTLTTKRVFTKGTLIRRVTDFTRKNFATFDMLNYIFKRMDGYTDVGSKGYAGVNGRELWGRIVGARNNRDLMMEDLQGRLGKPLKTLMTLARESQDQIPDLPVPAIMQKDGRIWTYESILAVAFNMGNVENMQRVMNGYDLSQEDLFLITDVLTEEAWRSVQEVWDVIDSLYSDIDRVHFNLNNFHMKKVPANELRITGKDITLRGGYYPIKYDSGLSILVSEWNEKDDLLNSTEAIFQVPAAKSGFVKARGKTGGGLPPRLSMSVLAEHINDTVQFITHAEAIRDVDRVTQNKEYQEEAIRSMGIEAYKMIRPALRYALRPEAEFGAVMDRQMNKERVRATAFILAYNFSVASKQVFSLPGVAYDIGVDNLLRGAAQVSADPSGSLQAMHEASIYMKNRAKNIDRDITDSLKKMKPHRRFGGASIEDVRSFGFILIKSMDFVAVFPSWWGAYHKGMADFNGDAEQAARYADEIIRASQPSSQSIDLSAVQRDRGFMRLFTMFSTFTLKYGNRQRYHYNAWRQGKLTNRGYAWNVWLESVMPPLLMGLMLSLIHNGEPPEGEEMITNLILYQFIGIPGIRDLAGYIARPQYGSPTDSPMLTGIKLVGNIGVSTVKAFKEGDDNAMKRMAWSMAELGSYYSGAPVSQVYKRVMKGVQQIESGDGNVLNLLIPDPTFRAK